MNYDEWRKIVFLQLEKLDAEALTISSFVIERYRKYNISWLGAKTKYLTCINIKKTLY